MHVNLISLDLIDQLVQLNTKIIEGKITHPASLAMKLEEITLIAWKESEELGGAEAGEIEMLPPSLRID